jgi:hypothetical protein
MSIASVVTTGIGPDALIRYVITEGFGANEAAGSAPVFSGPIPNFSTTVGLVFDTIFVNYFSNSPTSYSLTGSVPGLVFDTATSRLLGVTTTVGVYTLTVTATNSAGSGISNSFTVTVSAAVVQVPVAPTGFRMGIVGG